MRGSWWGIVGLAVVGIGIATTLRPPSRSDGSAAVQALLKGREPLVTSDDPADTGPPTFRTAYTWMEEVRPTWERASRLFRAEDGWRHRTETDGFGTFEVYWLDRPAPPTWLNWMLRRPTYRSSLTVRIGNGRAHKVHMKGLGGLVNEEWMPWTAVEVQDVGPANPPRGTPTSPPEFDADVYPAPMRREDSALKLPTLPRPKP